MWRVFSSFRSSVFFTPGWIFRIDNSRLLVDGFLWWLYCSASLLWRCSRMMELNFLCCQIHFVQQSRTASSLWGHRQIATLVPVSIPKGSLSALPLALSKENNFWLVTLFSQDYSDLVVLFSFAIPYSLLGRDSLRMEWGLFCRAETISRRLRPWV